MKIHITAKPVFDEAGRPAGKVPDGGCRITNLPVSGRQRILKNQLTGSFAPFTDVQDDRIVFHTKDGDITFLIDYPPGRHCLTCGERLPDAGPVGSEEEANRARACVQHVDTMHGADAERSDKWPHGYRSSPGSYDCTIEETELTKRLMGAGV